MPVRAVVRRSFYQDSMVLMRVAAQVRELPGVREVAALMGTPANHELLRSAGLSTPDVMTAAPGDLVLAVDADSPAAADAAMTAAAGLLDERQRVREAGAARPRTLDSAIRTLPGAQLAVISVPGAHAKLEALSALRRGLHVFLFSDNVPVADEVELKRVATERRLLCMGPDCGTAYVSGVGLGFANVVPRGRIGVVAASGTGLQAVASHLAALGEGISHGLGVGGRDLSAEVGGAMTALAIDALGADPATAVVVLVSKPPAASVLARLDAAIGAAGKPVVVCCLGVEARPAAPGTWVATLEDAARAAAAIARGHSWTASGFDDPSAVRRRLAGVERGGTAGRSLLGLYTGGTLAHEARLILEPLLGRIEETIAAGSPSAHRILDLGADEFTVGRPHPMLDPSLRDARVREAAANPDVGVLLVDVVLGRAVHPDPARSLAAAARERRRIAAAGGRSPHIVATVVGTEQDPQDLGRQIRTLEDAGVHVLPSGAQAARFAALLLRPDLAPTLLEATR